MTEGRAAAVLSVVLAACTFLAGLPALHAYRVAGAPVVLLATAAGSTFTATASVILLRLRAVFSYALSLAGLALLLVICDGVHPGAVATAIARGPNRIIAETLPLSGNRAALGALVVLVWICGAATSESVFRSRRPFPLALPVALYVVCYAVASSAPTRDRIGGPVLLAALALASALLVLPVTSAVDDPDPDVRPPSRYRAPATGLLVATGAAVVFASLAPTIPGLQSGPATLHRDPPTVTPVITDPVDAMGQLRDEHPKAGATPELAVSLSAPSDGYLALGDLDVYDGGVWRFTATFVPTGGRVPSTSPLPGLVGRHPVDQRITITGALPAPLLPALDRPMAITGLAADADPISGMLLPQAGGPTGGGFSVRSQAADATLSGLPGADGVDQAQGLPADTRIPPDTSADLATTLRFLSTLTGGVRPGASVAFLQVVLQALHSRERRIDPAAAAPPPTPRGPGRATTTTSLAPAAVGGTSLAQVINAVTVDRAATPEQFATFYAMVARYLGVPARLVTGFRLTGDSTGRALAAGSYQVTNRQAWAWVEIPVEGVGWVVCDPTPDATVAVSGPPPEAVSAPATTVPPRQANAVPRPQAVGGHALAPPAHISVPVRHPLPPALVAAAVAGAVVAAGLAAGPGQAAARRRWRRRQRRSSAPAELAVGAWLEVLDGLDRAGLRPAAGATSTEVAAEVGHHFGADLVPRAEAVAAVADRALFAPGSGLPIEDAMAAWENSRELTRRVRATLDGRQRLKSSLMVGSAPSRPSVGPAPGEPAAGR